MASRTTLLSGTEILRAVRDDLAPYRANIQPYQRWVTIIRFEATPADPPQWRWRMEACRISAEQNARSAVSALGHIPAHPPPWHAPYPRVRVARNAW